MAPILIRSISLMISYVIRRLIVMFFTFLLATALIFSIIQLPPGSYADYALSFLAAEGGQTTKLGNRIKERYGLDKPLYRQYYEWVEGIFRGDLGFSLTYRRPVAEVIADEILWTFLITGLAFGFAWITGIAIGIYSATHKYSILDHLFTFFGFVGLSIPNFVLAMFLIYFMVSAGTGITGGLFSDRFVGAPMSWAKFVDLLKHIWMPVVAIGTARMASVIRIMRGNLLEVINQPYIKTARSKGLRETKVILKHAVRVAINPLISLAGSLAPRLVSGIVVTAVVLNLPVIGPSFLESLKAQDMYLAGAYLLVILMLLLVGNLLADLALAAVDPRIRYE